VPFRPRLLLKRYVDDTGGDSPTVGRIGGTHVESRVASALGEIHRKLKGLERLRGNVAYSNRESSPYRWLARPLAAHLHEGEGIQLRSLELFVSEIGKLQCPCTVICGPSARDETHCELFGGFGRPDDDLIYSGAILFAAPYGDAVFAVIQREVNRYLLCGSTERASRD